MPKETGWSIAGESGLYTGWCLTRRGAIAEHVNMIYDGNPDFGEVSQFVWGSRLDEAQARAWAAARKRGDRAVKVTLTYRD